LNPDHRAFDRLEAAADASKRARELTHQLLTFSRGGLPIKTTASVAELLTDSAGFVLRGSNVRYELSIPHDLWSVDIDMGQVNQVVNNLFINALQAMPKGGTISVQAENCLIEQDSVIPLTPGEYVRIHIQDQGIGIPAENLQKIFDPYFTTKETGSGLGLTTAYSIIKRHDGVITVGSQVGVGTTFCVYLPASRASAAGPPCNAAPNSNYGRSGKILVMDDEEIIRELAAELLTQLGYEVSLVKDGASAISAYKQARNSGRPFDAVIMDLTIPGGMGGKDALQRIREIDPNVRAIVSSGYSQDPVMADFREYGFAGVLRKPYDANDVAEQLRLVLRGANSEGNAH
jgi:CheY-like chemotaxis protein/anti-sigma regulatory factor (Ser/Thr protein kinase)